MRICGIVECLASRNLLHGWDNMSFNLLSRQHMIAPATWHEKRFPCGFGLFSLELVFTWRLWWLSGSVDAAPPQTPCIRLLSKPTQISLYTKPRPAYGRQGLAWWIVGRVQFLWSHFSRLALRLECQKGAVRNCYSQSAKRVQSKTVTHSLPIECGPKLFPTACQEGAVQNCYSRGAPNDLLDL